MLRGMVTVLCLFTAASGSAPGGGAVRDDDSPGSAPDRARPRPAPVCEGVRGELPFFYDLYTFRGEAGRTAIVAAYAVAAEELRTEREAGCVQFRFFVSLILADTAVETVSRTDDSVTVRMPRHPRGDHLLQTHLEVEADPSASTLQRVIISDVTTPGYGQLYGGPFPIPDYSGTRLMLSDVALGQPDAEGGWTRGDVTLALVPTGRLPEGAFALYYEIYNLPRGHRYVTELLIQRVEEGPGGTVRELPGHDDVLTRYSGESAAGEDGTVAELLRVESRLREGLYRLTVVIRDQVTGQTAERFRLLRIGK